MNPPTLLNHPFDAQTSLSKLILTHYDLLMVITRFGIPLGFGDKSVDEVCQANGVDTNTLLAVVNILTTQSDTVPEELLREISAESLIAYLQRSHHYFLDYKLPYRDEDHGSQEYPHQVLSVDGRLCADECAARALYHRE